MGSRLPCCSKSLFSFLVNLWQVDQHHASSLQAACKPLGNVPERRRYPFMVSLRSPNATGGSETNPTHFCGGVLISASTVLTGMIFLLLGVVEGGNNSISAGCIGIFSKSQDLL